MLYRLPQSLKLGREFESVWASVGNHQGGVKIRKEKIYFVSLEKEKKNFALVVN